LTKDFKGEDKRLSVVRADSFFLILIPGWEKWRDDHFEKNIVDDRIVPKRVG
jgi:hypothetical protein